MKTLVQRFKQLHNDEAGQGLVEYVMLIALVIAAAAACFPGLSRRSLMPSRRLAPSWARTSARRRVVGRHSGCVLPALFVCSGSKGPAQTQPKL